MLRSTSRHPVLALAGLTMAGGVVLEAVVALTGLGGQGLSSFCDKGVYNRIEVAHAR